MLRESVIGARARFRSIGAIGRNDSHQNGACLFYLNDVGRQMRSAICWWMCKMFFNMGFYRVTVKGERASEAEAPILALAPHSSWCDAFPVVLLNAPSLVVKAQSQSVPFFHSNYKNILIFQMLHHHHLLPLFFSTAPLFFIFFFVVSFFACGCFHFFFFARSISSLVCFARSFLFCFQICGVDDDTRSMTTKTGR